MGSQINGLQPVGIATDLPQSRTYLHEIAYKKANDIALSCLECFVYFFVKVFCCFYPSYNRLYNEEAAKREPGLRIGTPTSTNRSTQIFDLTASKNSAVSVFQSLRPDCPDREIIHFRKICPQDQHPYVIMFYNLAGESVLDFDIKKNEQIIINDDNGLADETTLKFEVHKAREVVTYILDKDLYEVEDRFRRAFTFVARENGTPLPPNLTKVNWEENPPPEGFRRLR